MLEQMVSAKPAELEEYRRKVRLDFYGASSEGKSIVDNDVNPVRGDFAEVYVSCEPDCLKILMDTTVPFVTRSNIFDAESLSPVFKSSAAVGIMNMPMEHMAEIALQSYLSQQGSKDHRSLTYLLIGFHPKVVGDIFGPEVVAHSVFEESEGNLIWSVRTKGLSTYRHISAVQRCYDRVIVNNCRGSVPISTIVKAIQIGMGNCITINPVAAECSGLKDYRNCITSERKISYTARHQTVTIQRSMDDLFGAYVLGVNNSGTIVSRKESMYSSGMINVSKYSLKEVKCMSGLSVGEFVTKSKFTEHLTKAAERRCKNPLEYLILDPLAEKAVIKVNLPYRSYDSTLGTEILTYRVVEVDALKYTNLDKYLTENKGISTSALWLKLQEFPAVIRHPLLLDCLAKIHSYTDCEIERARVIASKAQACVADQNPHELELSDNINESLFLYVTAAMVPKNALSYWPLVAAWFVLLNNWVYIPYALVVCALRKETTSRAMGLFLPYMYWWMSNHLSILMHLFGIVLGFMTWLSVLRWILKAKPKSVLNSMVMVFRRGYGKAAPPNIETILRERIDAGVTALQMLGDERGETQFLREAGSRSSYKAELRRYEAIATTGTLDRTRYDELSRTFVDQV